MEVDNLFTKDELEELKLSDLKRIANYLQIKYPAHSKKADLIQSIMKLWEVAAAPPDIAIPETPTMSVRLQRIYERNGGKLP